MRPAISQATSTFWGKHGIKVKTVQLQGIAAINSVISGSSHFAQASASSFGRATARGQKLIAIATTIDRPFAQVVLRKEIAQAGGYDAKAPLAKRAALLKGRTIAVDSIQLDDPCLSAADRRARGLQPRTTSAWRRWRRTACWRAFQSKQIDGYAMSLPWPLKAVQDGEALLIASGPDGEPGDMIPFGHNMIAAKQDTCMQKKALCLAMGQSIKDATAFIKNKPDEAFALLKKRFPTLDDAAAEGLVRGAAQGDAVAAGGEQGLDRELGDLQRRGRSAQARREAEILRRVVHQRIRQLTERAMRPALRLRPSLRFRRNRRAALDDIVIAMPNFTFTSTPNLIAEELGLWAKHGLNVKIVQIAGVGATNAVIAGSADFAQAGGSTLTRAATRGQRLLAIANTAPSATSS